MLKIGDYFAIVFVLAISSALFIYINYDYMRQENSFMEAEIIHDGEVIKRLVLSNIKKDETVKYDFPEYGVKVEAKYNKIRISDSKCPNKLCVLHSWIEKPNDLVMCVPQKVMIKIIGSKQSVDTMAY